MKERIDNILVQKNIYDTIDKARVAVMAGLVFVGSERINTPSERIDIDKEITIKTNQLPYVSRGGLKLEKAIKYFNLDLTDKIMLDIGSSTGGFTDCALQNGIKHVYAIDVGYGQLDWKLRSDVRVTVLERTNFRYLEIDKLDKGIPDFASIDVSFISLKIILSKLAEFFIDGGMVVALIKPQFEAKKEFVGSKGIVRDKQVHKQVLIDIINNASQHNFSLKGLTYSPITGTDGNIEFLALLEYNQDNLNKHNNSDNQDNLNKQDKLNKHVTNNDNKIEKTKETDIKETDLNDEMKVTEYNNIIDNVIELAHRSLNTK